MLAVFNNVAHRRRTWESRPRGLHLIEQTKSNDKKTRKAVTRDSSKFYLKFYLYILAKQGMKNTTGVYFIYLSPSVRLSNFC